MMSDFLDETNKEFKEFVNGPTVQPPRELESGIFSLVHEDLNPNAWLIFSELSLIHFLAGVVTLSVCPQFGIRFFGDGLGLMAVFMSFGPHGCVALCGAFFIGVTFLISSFFLQRDELRILRKHRLLQASALILISLGAFIMLDAEILVGFGAAWVLGSLFGGLAMLEVGWLLRRA